MKKYIKIINAICPKCKKIAQRVGLFEKEFSEKLVEKTGWLCNCGFSEKINEQEIMFWKRGETNKSLFN